MIEFVVEALATFRLTRLITTDEITRPIRERFAPDGRISYLLTCPWCASPYAAAAVLVAGRSRIGRAAVRVLALSAVTGGLAEHL